MMRCRHFAVRSLERAKNHPSAFATCAVGSSRYELNNGSFSQIKMTMMTTTTNPSMPQFSTNVRCASSSRSSAMNMLPPPQSPQPQPKMVLPPNLSFDSRSSFASRFSDAAPIMKEVIAEEVDDRDHEKGGEGSVDTNTSASESNDQENNGDSLFWSPEGIVYTKPLPERLNVEIHTPFASDSLPSPSPSTLVGTIHLDASVFGLDPIRVDLLKRAVDYYRAKKRGMRKAVTKTIGQVSGSGRKIRPQKGGGVARAGHSRPPHFRGGAKAHGPKNITDYSNTKLNKKVRKLALRHVLSQKLKEGSLLLWNQMYDLPTHKTNDLARLLESWNIAGPHGASALLLDHYYHNSSSPSVSRSSRGDSRDDNDDPSAAAAAAAARVEPPPIAPSPSSSYAGVPSNLHAAARNLPALTVANSHGANVYDILKHEKLILTLSALQQIEMRLQE